MGAGILTSRRTETLMRLGSERERDAWRWTEWECMQEPRPCTSRQFSPVLCRGASPLPTGSEMRGIER